MLGLVFVKSSWLGTRISYRILRDLPYFWRIISSSPYTIGFVGHWVHIGHFHASILCSANNCSNTCLTFQPGFGDISILSWCFEMIFGVFLDADCSAIVPFTSFTRKNILIIVIPLFLAFLSLSLMRCIWRSICLWLQEGAKMFISIFPSQWWIWCMPKRTCW